MVKVNDQDDVATLKKLPPIQCGFKHPQGSIQILEQPCSNDSVDGKAKDSQQMKQDIRISLRSDAPAFIFWVQTQICKMTVRQQVGKAEKYSAQVADLRPLFRGY